MRIDPVSPDMKAASAAQSQAAIELVRRKVAAALGEAPAATEEMAEAAVAKAPSRHQQYMRELTASGKSLAEIQTEWHRYYTMLSDDDKRQVWQEFYDANQNTPYQQLYQKQASSLAAARLVTDAPIISDHSEPQQTTTHTTQAAQNRSRNVASTHTPRTKIGLIKHEIGKTISASGKLKLKHHIQSIAFGLSMGLLVTVVLLFGFFNEYFIAPIITPSTRVTDTPIIVSDNVSVNSQPTVIVPKINIEIPIDFNLPNIDESTVQASLNNGVIHYPSTSLPGENGNGAYFGHSSQNIFNNGKYKFAFVLLHQINTGDVFYINYNGTQYAYEVFAKEIVPPSQVSVLHDTKGKQATAVLITCDPPGFSTNRLVVWGEQIKPSPSTNKTASDSTVQTGSKLVGNGPTAWSRFVKVLQFWKKD